MIPGKIFIYTDDIETRFNMGMKNNTEHIEEYCILCDEEICRYTLQQHLLTECSKTFKKN